MPNATLIHLNFQSYDMIDWQDISSRKRAGNLPAEYAFETGRVVVFSSKNHRLHVFLFLENDLLQILQLAFFNANVFFFERNNTGNMPSHF